jgi:hypothetical protein
MRKSASFLLQDMLFTYTDNKVRVNERQLHLGTKVSRLRKQHQQLNTVITAGSRSAGGVLTN